MIWLRSVGAVLAALILVVLLAMVGTSLASGLLGESGEAEPGAAYVAVNLLLSFLSALAGGWLAARLAPRAPLAHAAALAAVIAIAGLVEGASAEAVNRPGWYLWTVTLLGMAGALAGGWMRSRTSSAALPAAAEEAGH
ncbi:MAG: hypothetical protein ACFBQW_09545 [Sphingomonadaceae bacterium]